MKLINFLKHFEVSIGRLEIKVLPLIFKGMLFLFFISACTPSSNPDLSGLDHSTVEFKTGVVQPNSVITPLPKSPNKLNDCPGLDNQLYQITQMTDPAGSAGQLGLKVKGEKVQVLLTLKSENTAFLKDFNAEVGSQSGTQVQAYVPFTQLCPLANMDTVLAIRPTAQAIQ